MTVAYVDFAVASVTNLGSTTITVTKPGTVVDGHLLVAFCASSGGSTFSPPAGEGWTQVTTPGSGTDAYWKIASGEGASWSFTRSSNSNAASVTVVVYSGSHQTTPITAAGITNNDSSTTVTLPSITPAGGATFLGQIVRPHTTRTWTPPGTTAERFDSTSAGGDETVTTGVATGTRVWTQSGAAIPVGGVMFAVAEVESIPSGAVSGTYDFSGSATGSQPSAIPSGSVSGTYDFSGSATGQQPDLPPDPSGDGRHGTAGAHVRFGLRAGHRKRRSR